MKQTQHAAAGSGTHSPQRRALFRSGAGIAALTATPWARLVQAQPRWPERPIRVVVPFTTGASADLVVRTVGEALGKRLGQPLVIENMPGASTKIGQDSVARSKADGYTWLFNSTLASATHAAVSTGKAADTATEFVMLGRAARVPQIIVARRDFPASSLRELVALARARPKTVNYASTGIGSPAHLVFALLEQQSQAPMTHVPYKGGGPILTDLLGGHADVSLLVVSTVQDHVAAGRVKALAMYDVARNSALPHVPTVAEQGFPPAELEAAYGFMGPAGTPAEVVSIVSSALQQVVADPAVQKTLRDRGLEPEYLSPDAYRARIQAESTRVLEIVRAVKIRAE